MLATDGEPYLRTPEANMGWVQRQNLDVIASYLAAVALVTFLAWRLLAAAAIALRGAH